MKAPLTGHQRKAGTDRAAATFAWLDQIADDAGLPPVAARVAIVLRRYFNGKTGAAWPSQDTLRTVTGLSRSGIQKVLRALVARGHLAVAVQKGRGATNEYRPILLKENAHQREHLNSEKAHDNEHGALTDDAQGAHAGEHRTLVDNPQNGAGAQSAPPAPEPSEVLFDTADALGKARALESAPLSLSPDLEGREPFLLPDHAPHEDDDASLHDDPDDRAFATLADLDRLADEEAAAMADPVTAAATALDRLNIPILADPVGLAEDLSAAFAGAKPDANSARHAADPLAAALLDAGPGAPRLWQDVSDIARKLFEAVAPDRSEDAMSALRDAVRDSGEAEKARRRAERTATATPFKDASDAL